VTNKKPVLPSLASYEELLEILNQEESDIAELSVDKPQEKIVEYTDDVVPFLSQYEIIPGDKAVKKSLLYKFYRAYSENPVDSYIFNRIVGQYIQYYSNSNGLFYKINMDSFRISKFILELNKQGKIDKPKSAAYRKRFEKFLKEHNIEKGEHFTPGFVIYEIYRDSLKGKHPEFSYKSFQQMLKLYFKEKRVESNRSLWYGVNKETRNYYGEEEIRAIKERRSKKKKRKRFE
jgi:hypothetical protein